MPNRGLTVLAAVAFGAVASAAAYSEAHSTEQKAFNGSTLTSVYVLKGTVARDESAVAASSQGLITAAQMPRQFVPVGAVTNLSTLGGRVAAADFSAGEVVVGSMFVPAAAVTGRAATLLTHGDVAVSVSVDQAQGVAGLIEPGDKVDVLLDVHGTQEAYLLRSVPVLAVGTDLAPPPGVAPAVARRTASTVADVSPEATTVLTFAVSPAAAARIASTGGVGTGGSTGVYLALEGPGDQASSFTTITGANFIPGTSVNLTGSGTGSSTTTGSTTTGSTRTGSTTGSTPRGSTTGGSSDTSIGGSAPSGNGPRGGASNVVTP